MTDIEDIMKVPKDFPLYFVRAMTNMFVDEYYGGFTRHSSEIYEYEKTLFDFLEQHEEKE